LLPGAGPALRRLREAGWLLFLVTNQSGIGRGYFTLDDVARVHERMFELLASDGVTFDKVYLAPESPDQPSRGRKPSPQYLWDARDEFGVDLGASVMVGDKLIDLECGWNAGVGAVILVRTGYGAETEKNAAASLRDARVLADIPAAAAWILEHPGLHRGRSLA